MGGVCHRRERQQGADEQARANPRADIPEGAFHHD
jgi:hypothetical protein